MPTYIKGKVIGHVQGDGATINMTNGTITAINGRTEAEVRQRYEYAKQRGASEGTARAYAMAPASEDAYWAAYWA